MIARFAKWIGLGIATSVLLTSGVSADTLKSHETSPPKAGSEISLSPHQRFAREQLKASILLFDRHMRVEQTGQYLDRVNLTEEVQTSRRSSIASTGVGLISLAIGDQLGVVDDAAKKAEFTLANLLGYADTGFNTPRSKTGWYKHFIDAYTGEGFGASKKVFSTIDTAILGVGASKVASYFSKFPNDPQAVKTTRLARELVESISWGKAIRFKDRPGIHQIFRGPDEQIEDRFWSLLFDEYVILPCLARSEEARNGVYGPGSRFWQAYVEDVRNLPQAKLKGHTVLAVAGNKVASHFTHQFAFYFCGDLSKDTAFLSELNELKQVDKAWFAERGEGSYPKRWWGLGAGSEIKFDRETGAIKYSAYGVARLSKNHNDTFSPAIMAGFLPTEELPNGVDSSVPNLRRVGTNANEGKGRLYSPIIADLIALHQRDECRYQYQGLDFLWRCTTRDPSLRVNHVEGVDFSTYIMGLAWFDPEIGGDFFKDHTVKAKVDWPVSRELRAAGAGPSHRK